MLSRALICSRRSDCLVLMSSEANSTSAKTRLLQLKSILHQSQTLSSELCSSSAKDGEWLSIGDSRTRISHSRRPELVPRLYVSNDTLQQQSKLRHLRWMIQKSNLGQDIFLVGPPGTLQRHLALQFCELTGREVEYVSLSRDTTETDLKQRREIIQKTAHYFNQAAVRAALEGRVLVLEGIEKAERNVLPILNNLLENREMQLEDGCFIVAAKRYDKLAKEHSKDVLDSWRLVRASEQFLVIALGLPVPPYKGNPLDPPLRSRFQARHVLAPPFPELLTELKSRYSNVSETTLTALLSVCYTLQSLTTSTAEGTVNLSTSVERLVANLEMFPNADLESLLHTVFPAELMGCESMFRDTLQRFGVKSDGRHSLSPVYSPAATSDGVCVSIMHSQPAASVSEAVGQFVVPGYPERMSKNTADYISVQHHEELLTRMLQSHMTGDLCLVGPRGCGKTSLVNQFASMLGYVSENVVLYRDMTSRELLQQRTTMTNGDTTWTQLPLVAAAREGHMAILDGIHQLDNGTLAVIKRLVQDRELQLTDGTRLMEERKYQAAMEAAGLTAQQMEERSIFSIHPKFRIVATAEPEKGGAGWLTPEVVSMFTFHHLTPLPPHQEKIVIKEKVPGVSNDVMDLLINFAHSLRKASDPTVRSLAASLSTRQLIRIARKMSNFPEQSIHTAIQRACLARFLPPLAKSTLLKALSDEGIISPGGTGALPSIECVRRGGSIRIGKTEIAVHRPLDAKALVPDVEFHDNNLHLHIMEEMLKDYTLGDHLLLVGNQGVGKNKITDRFLQLLNLPREYLQLHRDSTVQTLTSQLSVVDGMITYQDSPLVRAVQCGRVLVVDEADKAPIHVTAILRNIVGGESITLADGRKIVPAASLQTGSYSHIPTDRLIPIHPGFRMIVLANRPGFPFLGNNFFAALGDSFSCHAVDNPDIESEMVMLRQYGPGVAEDTLRKLVEAFSELREMADSGLLAYPYSTREVVNIVKHMQVYPGDGVASVVRNVFDFDSYSPELLEIVLKTLHKHGIPAGASAKDISLAPESPLPPLVPSGRLRPNRAQSSQLVCRKSSISLKVPSRVPFQWISCERDTVRSRRFSELKSQWTVPLHESIFITAACVSQEPTGLGTVHMLTGKLPSLYSLNLSSNTLHYFDLFHYLPSSWGSWRPKMSLTSLSSGPHAGSVLLHEAESNSLFMLSAPSPDGATLYRLASDTKLSSLLPWKQNKKQDHHHFLAGLSQDQLIVLHQTEKNELSVIDFSRRMPVGHTLFLPVAVRRVHLFSPDQWMMEDCTGNYHLLSKQSPHDTVPSIITPFEPISEPCVSIESASTQSVPTDIASSIAGESANNGGTECRLAVPEQALAGTISGLPLKGHGEESVDIHTVGEALESKSILSDIDKSSAVYLPEEGSVVYPFVSSGKESGQLEESGVLLINMPRKTFQKVQFPQISGYANLPVVTPPRVYLCPTGKNIIAVDHRGIVRLLEVSYYSLHESLKEWKKMVGEEDGSSSLSMRSTFSRDSGLDTTKPKHGKVDPSNAPHVGGNTWAGGTGGRDTAGLGGKGGPYRLDAGHNVFQLSDEEKMAVPEEVKRAAKELGQKALRERLKEIEMSEHDAKMYRELLSHVQQQVQILRVMLDNIQSKSTEREWLKNQTTGDFDERKLIDGLTGEKAVYKKRGERAPEHGAEQVYPKRIKMVVDVSGSMYRFNGHDGRLDRTMESTLMVMEAFNERHRNKFEMDIDGHSGDSPVIPFYNSNTPPSTDKERLEVLKAMHAHSQFCWTGDNTVEATRAAISSVAQGPADQRFVIVLSDANFSRYRIDPKQYGELMTSDPNVSVFAVFIGSLGDQAERLKEVLPPGRSFVCMDTKDLPIILQQILSSSLQ